MNEGYAAKRWPVGTLLIVFFAVGASAHAAESTGTLPGGAVGKMASSAPAQTAPATSRPASKIVLVRAGDKTITQEDYDILMRSATLKNYKGRTSRAMRYLTNMLLIELYLDEHPEQEPREHVERKVAKAKKASKSKTLEELDKKMRARGLTLDAFRREQRMKAFQTELVIQGEVKGKDEAFLKELFEADSSAYNDTRVSARHIMIRTMPYDTPAQKAAKRARIVKIREDLLSGKRTWDECVTETEDPRRKPLKGNVGYICRHLEWPESFSEVVFALKEGETSDIVETYYGYHIIQVFDRHEGRRDFEGSKQTMKIWLQQEPINRILREMKHKHAIVGYQPPGPPAHLLDALESRVTSGPASPPTTLPAKGRSSSPSP